MPSSRKSEMFVVDSNMLASGLVPYCFTYDRRFLMTDSRVLANDNARILVPDFFTYDRQLVSTNHSKPLTQQSVALQPINTVEKRGIFGAIIHLLWLAAGQS